MNENELNKIERITIRIFLLVVILWVSLVLYQSCSVAFIKGHHNTVNDTENVDASGEQLDVWDKRKGSITKEATKDEVIQPADSTITDQPADTTAAGL